MVAVSGLGWLVAVIQEDEESLLNVPPKNRRIDFFIDIVDWVQMPTNRHYLEAVISSDKYLQVGTASN